jgi:hypothetical protein
MGHKEGENSSQNKRLALHFAHKLHIKKFMHFLERLFPHLHPNYNDET